MNPKLLEIIRLAREGHPETALTQLQTYLQTTPDDARAWLVLGGLTTSPDARRDALHRAAQLAPKDELIQRAWQEFQQANPGQSTEKPIPFPPMAEFHAAREAREMPWPFYGDKDGHTLGRWLDEGQATRQDLEWAATEGETEALRDAAATLLRTSHRLPDVAMTPEAARLTAWPHHRANRPLGELVQSGQISPQELRQAAWHAPDARRREAARQLLPEAIRREARQQSQKRVAPTPTPHRPFSGRNRAARPLRVLQCSDYLRREIEHYRKQLTPLLLASLFTFLTSLYVLFRTRLTILGWTLAGLSLVITLLSKTPQRKINAFQLGKLGENHVASLLQKHLSGEWTLFRNLQLPGQRDDIDMVLVGPGGVYVLEVKTYRGAYRYVGQQFYRRGPGGRYIRTRNPGRDIKRRAAQLADHLGQYGFDLYVEPRLVWAGDGSLHLQEPEVYVWFPKRLPEELAQLMSQSPRLSTGQIAQITKKLQRVCTSL